MSPYVAHIRQTGRARWGMFRGSSTLLLRSARHYEPVVEVIAAAPPSAWDLDAHCYTTQAWPGIRQLDQQIRAAFGTPAGYQTPWRRKCCLAYSATCPRSTPSSGHGFSGDVRQGGKAFRRLGEFYREHADIIERNRILTLDFHMPHELRG